MVHAFSELSTGAWIGLAVLCGLAVTVLGIVTNAVLKDRGLGVFANGIVMLLGFMAGVLTRFAVFGSL